MAKRNNYEETMQAEFINWACVNHCRWPFASIALTRKVKIAGKVIKIPYKTLAFYHPPNGGQRSAITGAALKRIGTRPGVPDLILPVPVGGACGLVLELKAPKRHPSPEQKTWIEFLRRVGHRVEVCRSVSECIAATEDYLNKSDATPHATHLCS